ncbi:hypothetical protein C5614_19155 [Massilia phosphatilytica]|nr:hypothetical protein C5614_19155 [Massilia phosphatilytica]
MHSDIVEKGFCAIGSIDLRMRPIKCAFIILRFKATIARERFCRFVSNTCTFDLFEHKLAYQIRIF